MRGLPTAESDFSNIRAALPSRTMVHGPIRKEMTVSLPNFRTLPSDQQGRVGYILLWLLGVPIPILFLIYLLRGCS